MKTLRENLRLADNMLRSEERDLLTLARMSQRDAFTFYRGADLTGLDLSGQNLKGMNFDKADLRFSNLDAAQYDPGAFNGSVLDKTQKWLKDDFEFYDDDLDKHNNLEILIFIKFRPGLVDGILDWLGVTNASFAKSADVSKNALRKARVGDVVAVDTAKSIVDTARFAIKHTDIDDPEEILERLRQPYLQFLGGGSNAPFFSIPRLQYEELVRLRGQLVEAWGDREGGGGRWRDTPKSLEWHMRPEY
ncbi:hypothetical protein ABIC65_003332 [Sphingomonas trueperi]|uniref:pentapeptide repeat-containing protein n=1 Tax=Sphingomonas trueperi TaxID=53317 RepID=UPI0033936BED